MKKLQYIDKADREDYTGTKVNKKYLDILNRYYEYLKEISQTIDPNLYEAYVKSDRFHDYRLKRIKYNPYKKTIEIVDNGVGIPLPLERGCSYALIPGDTIKIGNKLIKFKEGKKNFIDDKKIHYYQKIDRTKSGSI